MGEAVAIVTDRGVVEEDVACARCGYNVRTLRTSGLCSECGYAVAESMDAEKRWERARWRMVGYGAACLAVFCVANLVSVIMWGGRPYGEWLRHINAWYFPVAPVRDVFCIGFLSLGVFFLLRGRPAHLRGRRWVAVICVALICVQSVEHVLGVLSFVFHQFDLSSLIDHYRFDRNMNVATALAKALLLAASYFYMRNLARSTGKGWMRQVTTVYALVAGGALAYWVVYMVVMRLGGAGGVVSAGTIGAVLDFTIWGRPGLDFCAAVVPLIYWCWMSVVAWRAGVWGGIEK